MSLSGAIARLQVHSGALSGVKEAPAVPPESANQFPFAVAYPAEGHWQRITDTKKGLHTVLVEFHCDRSILPLAVAQATAFVEAYPNLILNDPTLNGQVDTILMDSGTPIKYEFGWLEWGSIRTVGVRFFVTIKIQDAFT